MKSISKARPVSVSTSTITAEQAKMFTTDQANQLQFFADRFDCTHSKFLRNGLEVRVLNVDTGKHDARNFISYHRLNLEVLTEGNMVQYRAFLVRPI